jgi:hypothetical protein
MRIERIVETVQRVLELSEDEADALTAVGKRLASTKTFWRDARDDTDSPPATVIRCERIAHQQYRVTVAEAVGIVALPSMQLIVEPKIPPAHFRFLLERSSAFPRLGDQHAQAAQSAELWDLVARWFVDALERLLRRGLVADYEERHDELPFIRGTVRSMDTAVSYYQGRVSFACSYDQFGLNSPLNRVLRAAALTVAAAPILDSQVRRRARQSLSRLTDVDDLRPTDLWHSPERRSAHYGVACQLARHVLTATGRTIDAGDTHAWTFLIRTPELVEDAVRNILRQGLLDLVPVTKSGLQLKPSKLRLNPDLVFGAHAIGDVKYSLLDSDWRRSHLYQAIAFATGYGVRHAAVFGFSPNGSTPPEVQVGAVRLRSFAWVSSASAAPADSAAKLTADARAWFEHDIDPMSPVADSGEAHTMVRRSLHAPQEQPLTPTS